MEVRSLKDIEFSILIECFLKAFENYYVPMPTDPEYYRNRWKAAKLDLSLSFGVFDGAELVGFILNAVDKRLGNKVAFNTGTGVLPSHRGQRLVHSIYQRALPILKEEGITLCSLEVIQENTRAIKAYERIGFEKTKSYLCFGGEISPLEAVSFSLEKKDIHHVDWKTLTPQSHYSWDNKRQSLMAGNFEFYQLEKDGDIESYFILDQQKAYIAQLDCFSQNEEAWHRLFAGIKSLSPSIKINNVSADFEHKIKYLKRFGLKNTVNQFEMEMSI